MNSKSLLKDSIKTIIPNALIKWRRKVLYEKPLTHMREMRAEKVRRSKQIHSVSVSQAGQDFWVYGEVFNEKRGGYFVDIGAHDGVYLSNTFILEKRYGWTGICIEANEATFDSLKKNRTAYCVNSCIDSFERTVRFVGSSVMGGIIAPDCDNKSAANLPISQIQTETLAAVLNRLKAPKAIDYLSIDIEGAEDRALLKFPFCTYRFSCMTVERPSTALRQVLSENDYLLIKEIPGLDCFYVHRSHQEQYWNNMVSFYEKKFILKRWDGETFHL